MDFGKKSPRTFNLSAAAAEGASATISLHLDEPGGQLLGTVSIAPTASIDTYTLFNTSIAKNAATGTHDLYLCIEQAKGDVRLDWWQFKK